MWGCTAQSCLRQGSDTISQGLLPGVFSPCVCRHVARNLQYSWAWIQLLHDLRVAAREAAQLDGCHHFCACQGLTERGLPINPILCKPLLAGGGHTPRPHYLRANPCCSKALTTSTARKCLPCFFQEGTGRWGTVTVHPPMIPAGSPRQAISRAGLLLTRTGLKPETPSCLSVLTSALVWNRNAFGTGCCLPKMDQRLHKSYLANLAWVTPTMFS